MQYLQYLSCEITGSSKRTRNLGRLQLHVPVHDGIGWREISESGFMLLVLGLAYTAAGLETWMINFKIPYITKNILYFPKKLQ